MSIRNIPKVIKSILARQLRDISPHHTSNNYYHPLTHPCSHWDAISATFGVRPNRIVHMEKQREKVTKTIVDPNNPNALAKVITFYEGYEKEVLVPLTDKQRAQQRILFFFYFISPFILGAITVAIIYFLFWDSPIRNTILFFIFDENQYTNKALFWKVKDLELYLYIIGFAAGYTCYHLFIYMEKNVDSFDALKESHKKYKTIKIKDDILDERLETEEKREARLLANQAQKLKKARLDNPEGSAKWFSEDLEAQRKLTLNKYKPYGANVVHGIMMGRIIIDGRLLRLHAEGHGMVMAKTGAGKSVYLKGVLTDPIQRIRRYNGSNVVYDPGGFIHKETKDFQESIGQKVIYLNFSMRDGEPTNYINPLHLLNPSQPIEFQQMIDRFSERLAPNPNKDGKNNYWYIRGQQIIQLLLYYMCADTPREEWTLHNLYLLTTKIDKDFLTPLTSHHTSPFSSTIRALAKDVKAILEGNPEKFEEFRTTGNINLTRFQKGKPLEIITSKSDFSIKDIKEKANISLYINVLGSELREKGFFLRFILELCLDACEWSDNHDDLDKRTFFFIDEFPSLGRMERVTKGMNELRKREVSIILFVQNLPQLQEHYPKEYLSIESACTFKLIFGTRDYVTAIHVSKDIGNATEIIKYETTSSSTTKSKSTGKARGQNHGTSTPGMNLFDPSRPPTNTEGFSEGINETETTSTSENISEQQIIKPRPLKTADEIKRIPSNRMIIDLETRYCERPIYGYKAVYYEDPEWKDAHTSNDYDE